MMSEEELIELREVFKTVRERRVRARAKPSAIFAGAITRQFDKDGDGTINVDELGRDAELWPKSDEGGASACARARRGARAHPGACSASAGSHQDD